jgi:hypothetical protein
MSDKTVTEQNQARMQAFRDFIGLAANGLSDHELRRLVGFECFCAGWYSGLAWIEESVD